MLALEKLELHDQVLECCEILLSKNDKDVDALVTKGIALNKTGNHEDALTLYDLALELDAGHWPKTKPTLRLKVNMKTET